LPPPPLTIPQNLYTVIVLFDLYGGGKGGGGEERV